MREWLTIQEACEVLGLSDRSVRNLFASGKLDAHKEMHKSRLRWLVARESVEELARKREEKKKAKPKGKKLCCRCKEWKEEAEFRRLKNGYLDSYCVPCRRAICNESKPNRNWTGFGTDAVSDGLSDIVGPGGPARPEDSLKYACMNIGFAHRPIPRGQTKRQAFCAKCKAERCVHHPEMTPEEVRYKTRPKVIHSALFDSS